MDKRRSREVVVDTSSLAKLLLNEEGKERVYEEIRGKRIIVLDFQISEFSNVLWKRGLDVDEAKEKMSFFLLLVNEIVLSLSVWEDAYKVAKRRRISFYDAAVIALAKRRKAKLVTSDKWQYDVAVLERVDARLLL